jgi:hypothetical protein
MSRAVLNDAAMQITCGTDRARFVISLSSDAIYISKWGEIWVAVLGIRSRESEAVTSPSKLKKLVISSIYFYRKFIIRFVSLVCGARLLPVRAACTSFACTI